MLYICDISIDIKGFPNRQKSLFPVQRVARIKASREAENLLFFLDIIFLYNKRQGKYSEKKEKNL